MDSRYDKNVPWWTFTLVLCLLLHSENDSVCKWGATILIVLLGVHAGLCMVNDALRWYVRRIEKKASI